MKIFFIFTLLQLTIEPSFATDSSLLGTWSGEGGKLRLSEDGSCEETYFYSENNPDSACRYELKGNELQIIRGNSQNRGELEIHFKYTVREDRIYSDENEILKKEEN
jgi:hypothetical protein